MPFATPSAASLDQLVDDRLGFARPIRDPERFLAAIYVTFSERVVPEEGHLESLLITLGAYTQCT
jgi:hypothetical protein